MPNAREVYFEHVVVGRQVKVSAVCSLTHVEVSILGPLTASQRDLETLALRNLDARIAALKSGGGTPSGGWAAGPGRGRLV